MTAPSPPLSYCYCCVMMMMSLSPLPPFRTKIFQDIERLIHPNDILDKVVYDLDIQR